MKMSSITDYYHQSVTGGKYTATDKAGECAAVVTNMDGYSYLAVTLGGKLKDALDKVVDALVAMSESRMPEGFDPSMMPKA